MARQNITYTPDYKVLANSLEEVNSFYFKPDYTVVVDEIVEDDNADSISVSENGTLTCNSFEETD